jgi:hypothetical protein
LFAVSELHTRLESRHLVSSEALKSSHFAGPDAFGLLKMCSEDAVATRRIRHFADKSRKTRAFREQHEDILAIRKSVWQSRNWTMLGLYEVQLIMAMR